MTNKIYDDCYARIQKESGGRETIRFYRNNLSKEDFIRLESGNYCVAGEGEYKGLSIRYFVEISPEIYNSPGIVQTRLPIEFRGRDSIKGVVFRIKKHALPTLIKDRTDGISINISWNGTFKKLACVNVKEKNILKYRKYIQRKVRV